ALANPAPQVETVNAATANKLVFVTGARTFTAGACGGAANVITVQLQDAFGNPVNAAAGGQALTAATTSAGGKFYSDSACGTLASGGGFTIAATSSTASLYYADTTAGTPSVSLTNPSSLTNPAAQLETVTAGAANKLVFLTAS